MAFSWMDWAPVLPHITLTDGLKQLLSRGSVDFLQAAAVGGSLLTSKMLMMGALKDHPLSLLSAHVSILWVVQTRWPTSGKRFHARSPSMMPREIGAFWFVIQVLTACICLISAYKVLRFAGSVSTAVMLLSMHFSSSTTDRDFTSSTGEILSIAIRVTVFVIGFAFVLAWDYRVNVTSRDMSVAFLVSSYTLALLPTIAVALQDRFKVPWFLRANYRPVKARQWTFYVLPALGIVAYLDESRKPFVGTVSTGTCIILVMNLVLTSIASIVFLNVPTSDQICVDGLASFETRFLIGQDVWKILAFSGSVSLGSWLLPHSPMMLSSWQIVGYVTSLAVSRHPPSRWLVSEDPTSNDPALLLGDKCICQRVHNPGIDDTAPSASSARDLRQKVNTAKPQMILALVLWCLLIYTIWPTTAISEPDKPEIYSATTPSSDFDIVIAAHSRRGIEIARDIDDIMSLRALRNRTTNVYVYNKGPENSQLERDIRQYLHDPRRLYIQSLDNKGREGGTYLHHIVSQWDSIARHTLFLQEQAHDFALLKLRIADYLVPQTGFMSLSYEGKTWKQCEHLHTGAWPSIAESIARVSSMVDASDTCQDVLLTFRGQFLASDTRIRSNRKALYVILLQGLIDAESWMHAPEMLRSPWDGANLDSVEDPVFGYTLERLWGVIMRCSNENIADRSPSLLGSFIRSAWFGQKVPLEDVQCLDDD